MMSLPNNKKTGKGQTKIECNRKRYVNGDNFLRTISGLTSFREWRVGRNGLNRDSPHIFLQADLPASTPCQIDVTYKAGLIALYGGFELKAGA